MAELCIPSLSASETFNEGNSPKRGGRPGIRGYVKLSLDAAIRAVNRKLNALVPLLNKALTG